MMTENMRFWLEELIEDHLETARFEHMCALGSPNGEAAMLHEMNSDEHRAFANMLKDVIKNSKD